MLHRCALGLASAVGNMHMQDAATSVAHTCAVRPEVVGGGLLAAQAGAEFQLDLQA